MKRWMLCSLMFALSLGFIDPLAVAAQEEKKPDAKKDDEKPAKAPAPKAPDWSKYAAKTLEAGGEVIKVGDTTLTLRNTKRQGNKNVNMDVDYTWNEQGMARREKPPTFFNDKGLPRPGTADEIARLKKPEGVKGYMMERSDLKNGDLVRVELIRLSSVSATKAKPEDYTIKYAFMVGEKANPSAPPKK